MVSLATSVSADATPVTDHGLVPLRVASVTVTASGLLSVVLLAADDIVIGLTSVTEREPMAFPVSVAVMTAVPPSPSAAWAAVGAMTSANAAGTAAMMSLRRMLPLFPPVVGTATQHL
jgi:hypothetical protein